ncbi:MAG: MFS transporter [Aliihoeflea sp.]|uniref:MFS transporter n=1 Tax=Aliihoeflea sp. TaxID=2608088 RepID=UPI004034B12A
MNFSLADVRDGLGPFLGVFLIGHGWAADEIGYVMTLGGLAGMLATTPLGALVDATRFKRTIIAAAAGLIILGTLALLISTDFWVVAGSQVGTSVFAAIIAPAIAGLTLGLVGRAALPTSSAGTRPGTTAETWSRQSSPARSAMSSA